MKLACADFTWPLLPHEKVLDLIHALDIEGLDLGLLGNRSHVRPEVVRQDIPMWSGILKERIERAGLELADFYLQAWTDSQVMAVDNPDPKQRDDSRALFLDMLEVARRLDASGITTLPGVPFDGQSWQDAMALSAEELKWRVDQAGKFGGEVFNRWQQNFLQRVEGGDVSEELGSNQLLVVASASSARGILVDLEVRSRAFTPQGDGVNDQLSIQYTLFWVQHASEVKIGIYALDGRRVWQARPEAQAAGRHTVRWDGRDGAGQLVGPGIYLARVEVETDKGREIRLQPVAVAY